MFLALTKLPVLFSTTTPLDDTLSDGSTILSSLTQWATSITTWIFGNPMARMFLAIMLIMLGLHFVKSFIRTA